jgi:hypothetical protein
MCNPKSNAKNEEGFSKGMKFNFGLEVGIKIISCYVCAH